jgi:hypothetical protein
MGTDAMEADVLGDLDLYRFEGAEVATGGNAQAKIIVMVIFNPRSQESLVFRVVEELHAELPISSVPTALFGRSWRRRRCWSGTWLPQDRRVS